jgi:hypothetical protein
MSVDKTFVLHLHERFTLLVYQVEGCDLQFSKNQNFGRLRIGRVDNCTIQNSFPFSGPKFKSGSCRN